MLINNAQAYLDQLYGYGGIFIFCFILLVIWHTIWKGLALWKAGTRREKWWFIALLIINTVGILEILYLFVFSKDKKPST